MKYLIPDIASMLIEPSAGPNFVYEKIYDEWESKIDNVTLLQCLKDVLSIYFELISTEISFNNAEKLKAVEVELRCRIQQKKTFSH